MKNTIRFLIVVFFSFFYCHSSLAGHKKFVWQWNQTNKAMPEYVKDSVNNYFMKQNRNGYAFTIWGTGVSADKKNIDGVYQFRLFVTHQPMHLMIIYQESIYIIESLTVPGIIAEMCRFIEKTKPDRHFCQNIYNVFYATLFDEYEACKIEDGKYIPIYFNNEIEKQQHIKTLSRTDLILNLSAKMLENNSVVSDFPYYILTQNLNEEECILLLGIIKNGG